MSSKGNRILTILIILTISLIVFGAYSKGSHEPSDNIEQNPATFVSDEEARMMQEEADKLREEERVAKQSRIDSAVYIEARELALIIKDPTANKGRIFKVWGEISQFDSATGTDAFRAYVSNVRQSYWAIYGENVIMVGEASTLADFVKDDVFIAIVEVGDPQTYDNVMGGGNTVPTFIIHSITRK